MALSSDFANSLTVSDASVVRVWFDNVGNTQHVVCTVSATMLQLAEIAAIAKTVIRPALGVRNTTAKGYISNNHYPKSVSGPQHQYLAPSGFLAPQRGTLVDALPTVKGICWTIGVRLTMNVLFLFHCYLHGAIQLLLLWAHAGLKRVLDAL